MKNIEKTDIDPVINDFIEFFKYQLQLAKGKTEISQNIKYRISINDASIEIVVSMPGYFRFIEEGVNGTQQQNGSPYSYKNNGRPIPVQPLYDWIQVKNISLPYIKSLRETKDPKMTYAYMLSHSIKKKGIKPTPILKDAIEQFQLGDKLIERLRDKIKQMINEEFIGQNI